MATVASGLCLAEVVLQSEEVRGQHTGQGKIEKIPLEHNLTRNDQRMLFG